MEKRPRIIVNRPFVIVQMGPVRRAHGLKNDGALGHDIGNAKFPPISMSCPQLKITRWPGAIVFNTSMVAAALLLTTVAASQPVNSISIRSIFLPAKSVYRRPGPPAEQNRRPCR